MKKLTTIAVAVALAAPMAVMADTTIYGRINQNLVHQDTGSADEWDVENNASRFGVKGSEDLGNGLKAIFQYEWSVDSSDAGTLGGRLAYTGLSGGFGTVALGRQWTPYYFSVDKTDIFQTNTMNDEYMGVTRVGNALVYISPNFNGLVVKAALIMGGTGDTEDNGEDGVDTYNLSLDYNNGPLSVGFSHLSFEGTANRELTGIAAKYNFGNFAIIGQYEDEDNNGTDEDAFGLAAEAYFGMNTVRIKYGERDEATDTETWAIGVEHKFSKRTRVFAEFENTEVGSADTDRFGLGIRHDF